MNDILILPSCLVSDVEILAFETVLSKSYLSAIPVKGYALETTRSKASFAFSNSNSCVVR